MSKRDCKRCRQLRWVAMFVCIVAVVILMMLGKSQAGIYKYTDANGKKVYVGSLSQVPQAYRDQIVEQVPTDAVSNVSQFSDKNRSAGSLLKKNRDERRMLRALEQMETPVKIANNQVLVPVTVTYHGYSAQVTMLMDTGASGTVFHHDALEKLEPKKQEAGYARVAGGGIIKLSTIAFDSIKIGPYKARNLNAYVMQNKNVGGGFDGLLGMDFLMNVEYELDKARQVIIWNPKKYHQLKKSITEVSELNDTSAKK
ncbi:aspartyl protease family protein [Neptunomonas sp. CHC150]|uniref:aspartyl protease family protein n=1 Tax=Neptunomonas sp. CHC150 TaxID=2998324 RepID=UPI0025B1463F|nr:aspartyl protease family protein [Neptunomonas sp. CHC150]MDN2658822.1 aspartyl protease family protein [Neptunomonas sp. CHC150]